MTSNLPALSTLTRQIGALTEQLQPVTDDTIAKALRMMMGVGLSLPATIDPASAVDAYAVALEGIGREGVERAAKRVIRGEYDIHKGFVPTAPEFAALARKEARTIGEDLARLRESQATLEDATRPRAPSNPEMIARIKQMNRDYQHRHQAEKSREDRSGANAPIDDERRARLEKILAAPERPGIRPEEVRLANEMANRIGGQA